MLLSTLMGKNGLMGLIKVACTNDPTGIYHQSKRAGYFMCGFSSLCLRNGIETRRIKRLLAWSSMAHVSLMAAGILYGI
ncbi:MAG: hypothetical protein IPJ54_00040 [Saprospiraceae bacterium]|nr:hypothetical protein [Saprospiraceae bacterium]